MDTHRHGYAKRLTVAEEPDSSPKIEVWSAYDRQQRTWGPWRIRWPALGAVTPAEARVFLTILQRVLELMETDAGDDSLEARTE
jgi:hypothetical protein